MKQLTIFFLILFSLPVVHAQDAAEILRKMEDVMRGESSYAEMSMKIVRPRYEREISLRSWHIGTDYSMILITAPSRDRGSAFLMRKNDIWSYDPRIDRTTRMPSSMMAQSWMGSDFTNDDLVRDSDIIDDYEHKVLRTEEYEGRECYVLELIPKPGTPIVWGKVLMWVTTDNYLQLRIEQYDQRDRLVNTLKLDEIKTFDGREVPSRFTVIPAGKENHRTILTYQKLEFDIDINESFFSQENMLRLD
ncbi:MAG: outer membrane lipoprotein-sorting protein [Chitinophagaceae bacterium]|nr:MAG: outer membrane lipoprotein-sorting protein [Chitinophagaceae bacterium]